MCIIHHLSIESLESSGQESAITAFLLISWWEPVPYANKYTLYTNKEECLACIVGIAEHQGVSMTWLCFG
jgi:hypothetical protein